MKLSNSLIIFFFNVFLVFSNTNVEKCIPEKVSFVSKDNLIITADLYKNINKNANVIVLCHQARYSRGEYIETAQKLVEFGYTCLALDQRSGEDVNGIINETAKLAKKSGLKQEYSDAFPDLEAALNFVKFKFSKSKIMMVGSSYSSALVIIMAAKYPKEITAIASFSPGEYFLIDNKKVEDFAKKVNCPVFIASAKNEAAEWKGILKAIPNQNKVGFLPHGKGFHGSKALWSSNAGNEEYWTAFSTFLLKYFPA